MPESVQILQSTLLKRVYKRLHPNEKADVDDAIAEIVVAPTRGEVKEVIWPVSLCTSLNAMGSLPCWPMNMTLTVDSSFLSVPMKTFIVL